MAKIDVYCKLPAGLHILIGGVSQVINGTNTPDVIQVHGAAVTRGVDEDLFDEFCKQQQHSPIIKSGHVYKGLKSDAESKAKAKDLKESKTGLEQLPQIDKAAKIEPKSED